MTAGALTPARLAAPAFGLLAAAFGILAGVHPIAAIGLALGLAIVLLVFSDLAVGLAAFTLLAFLESLIVGSSLLSVTKVMGVVLAAAWVARQATFGERDNYISAHPTASYLLLGFLAWGALSATWSDDSGATLLALSRYLLVIVLFVIVYSAVKTPRDVALVIGAFVIGTGFTAMYGLVNRPEEDAVRAASSVGGPNTFAAVLVAGIAVTLGAMVAVRGRPALRVGALAVVALAMVAFVYAGSRGGAVSLAVALVVAILIAGRWRAQVAVIAVGIAIATTLAFIAFAPEEIKSRFSESTTTAQFETEEGRVTLWKIALEMFEDQPLHGAGMGSFPASSIDYLFEAGRLGKTFEIVETPEAAHNVYLQALAELGVLGAALFLAIYGFPVVCAVLAARQFARTGPRELEIIARALVVALASLLTAIFFIPDATNKLLWLLLGLGPALLAVAQRERSEGETAGAAQAPAPVASAYSRS